MYVVLDLKTTETMEDKEVSRQNQIGWLFAVSQDLILYE